MTQQTEYFLDWSFDEDEYYRYKFLIPRNVQSFSPNDKIVLRKYGRSHVEGSISAIVIECLEDGIIVQAEKSVDISESYSIEKNKV